MVLNLFYPKQAFIRHQTIRIYFHIKQQSSCQRQNYANRSIMTSLMGMFYTLILGEIGAAIFLINHKRIQQKNIMHNGVVFLIGGLNIYDRSELRFFKYTPEFIVHSIAHFIITLMINKKNQYFKKQLAGNIIICLISLILPNIAVYYYLLNIIVSVFNMINFYPSYMAISLILTMGIIDSQLAMCSFLLIYGYIFLTTKQLPQPLQQPYNEIQSLLTEYQLHQLQFESEQEKYNKTQKRLYKEFMEKINSECGPREDNQEPFELINQYELYKQFTAIENKIYNIASDTNLFELKVNEKISKEEIEQFKSYTIQFIQKNQIAIDEKRLQKLILMFTYSVFPNMPMQAMKVLAKNNIKQITTDQNMLLCILYMICTACSVHSGFDDHYVVQIQHYYSMIFNDRSPNSRAALAGGLQLIKRLDQDVLQTENFFQNYSTLMLASDIKQYTTYIQKFKSGDDKAKLLVFAQAIRNAYILKHHELIPLLERQKKFSEMFGFTQVEYMPILAQMKKNIEDAFTLIDLEYLDG